MNEIREAAEDGVPEKIEDEVGDLLFAAVNLARHLGVNPDSALGRANRKFSGRFRRVEQYVAEESRSWKEYPSKSWTGSGKKRSLRLSRRIENKSTENNTPSMEEKST